MKKNFSHIMLFALLIGVFQPVLPMVQYVAEGGDLIIMLTGKVKASFPSDNVNTDKDCTESACSESATDKNESLLDTDYYPVPLQLHQSSAEHHLAVASEKSAFFNEQILLHYYSSDAPPPRWV